MTRPIQPPSIAPTIPRMIVMTIPPGSRPGMRSFATIPTTRPKTIHSRTSIVQLLSTGARTFAPGRWSSVHDGCQDDPQRSVRSASGEELLTRGPRGHHARGAERGQPDQRNAQDAGDERVFHRQRHGGLEYFDAHDVTHHEKRDPRPRAHAHSLSPGSPTRELYVTTLARTSAKWHTIDVACASHLGTA